MATKVKPSRLNITGTPQAGNVPVYVDEDNFQWGAGGGGGSGDVVGPNSATDGHLAVFDGATGKLIKDGGAVPTGTEIVYATQAEYTALLPGAESDGKHYFIYTESGGGGWQPGANTVAYYPLSVDFNDASGNGYNLTNTGGSITTVGGVNCAYYNGSSCSLNTSNPTFSGTYTISARRRPASTSGVMGVALAGTASSNSEGDYRGLQQNSGVIWASDWFTTNRSVNSNFTVSANTWYLLTTTVSNYRDVTIYVNGALKNSLDRGISLYNQTGVIVGAKTSGPNTFSEKSTGYISNVIFEDKARTVQEVADYYNQTKANYGL